MLQALLIIVVGLAAGVVLDRFLRTRGAEGVEHRIRTTLQVVALTVVNPIAFVGALWALPVLDLRLVLLPVVGLGTLAGAFVLGSFAARALGLDPTRAVLFRTGISFTNIGNLGGLAVFQILGEGAYALVPLYKLFEELWYYGFLFPHTNLQKAPRGAAGAGLVKVVRDPFVLIVLAALAVGFGLHLSGLERPGWYGPLNSVLVPTSTLFLLISVGMAMRFSLSRHDTVPALVLTALKVGALPLIALALAGLAGFWTIPLVWKTVLILSCMPMAFLSMVPPSLYGLDGKFTTTAWAFTMVSMAITLPLLMLL